MDGIKYFDEVAPNWDEIRKSFFPDTLRNRLIELSQITAEDISADIGAGTGFLTEELINKSAKVFAVDQSSKMVLQLKKKFCCNNKISIRNGTDNNLPIDNGSIDYIFANMFLHHVGDPQTAINEMVRILKPGGKLLVSDLDEHNFEFLVSEQHDKWMGFKRSDIGNWFKNAGLTDINIFCADAHCCTSSNNTSEKAEISIFIVVGKKKEI